MPRASTASNSSGSSVPSSSTGSTRLSSSKGLKQEEIRAIVHLLMQDISVRLDDLGIAVELTPAAADHLAKVGYDPSYGARPMRRVLQRAVENELSKRLLRGEYQTGDTFWSTTTRTPAATTSSTTPRPSRRRTVELPVSKEQ
ncbi:MAG: hypothetical protein R2854_02080 [Caldilineaceae bacterium]